MAPTVPPLRFPPAGLALAYLPVLALLAVAGLQSSVPADVLLRDANAVAAQPFYVGALSALGVSMWAAATTIALFAWAGRRRSTVDAGRSRLLWSSGSLTAVLMLDDMLQIHEEVLPGMVGVAERTVLVGYALLGLAWFVASFRTICRTEVLPLLLAGAFFGLSVTLDLLPTDLVPGLWRLQTSYVEDGTKLLGVASWLAYLTRVALRHLERQDAGGAAG